MHDQELPAAQKRWWRAIWRGLVVDPEAKHYRTIGPALWLLIYLIIHADPATGVVRRKYKTIAEDMGLPARTVRGWLARLSRGSYVWINNTGRSLVIHIGKWKNASAPHRVSQPRHMSGTGKTL
jgi:hypothetical protein